MRGAKPLARHKLLHFIGTYPHWFSSPAKFRIADPRTAMLPEVVFENKLGFSARVAFCFAGIWRIQFPLAPRSDGETVCGARAPWPRPFKAEFRSCFDHWIFQCSVSGSPRGDRQGGARYGQGLSSPYPAHPVAPGRFSLLYFTFSHLALVRHSHRSLLWPPKSSQPEQSTRFHPTCEKR